MPPGTLDVPSRNSPNVRFYIRSSTIRLYIRKVAVSQYGSTVLCRCQEGYLSKGRKSVISGHRETLHSCKEEF